MGKYILKRLLQLIPVLFIVSFVIFFIMYLAPGDPGSIILGPTASQEAIDEMNEKLGFYDPFLTRFSRYLYNAVFKLDFGTSYKTGKPVFEEILPRVPISLSVAFNGMLCAALIGIPLGVFSAVKQYSLLDTLPTVIAMVFAATPLFWLGMILLLVFSLELGLLPSYGVGTWKHSILPMLAIGLPYAARQLRFTRSSMLETIREDYVRTARAKGATERAVIWKHALKNALLPVITVLGNNFGSLFGGAVVTETLFAIPGIGTLLVNGINTRDVPIVTASVLVVAVIFSLIMLGVDLLYAFIDPRIKSKYTK